MPNEAASTRERFCVSLVETTSEGPTSSAAEAVDIALQLRRAGRSAEGVCVLDTWIAAWPGGGAREPRRGEADLHNRRGDLLVDLMRYDQAAATYERAYAIATAQGREEESGIIANNLGLLRSIGYHSVYAVPETDSPTDLEEAARWFVRATEHAENSGDPRRQIKAHNNAGMVFTALMRTDEAVSHYGRAAEIARQAQDLSQVRKALASVAYALLGQASRRMEGRRSDAPQQGRASDAQAIQEAIEAARAALSQAYEAAEEAGEPPQRVCETFGRYEEICLELKAP